MRVFVSSVISGFEEYRRAAAAAAGMLGHDVIRAEDFGARASSPQVACLSEVRRADLIVLVMAERYGAIQSSGLSATHEEYRDAKDNKPILAFVQQAITPEPAQAAFIEEVQRWMGGALTGAFQTPDELKTSLVGALHRHSLALAETPIDGHAMVERATALLPERERHQRVGRGQLLHIAVAGSPSLQLLRPSELEDPALGEAIGREALFGTARIFDGEQGRQARSDDQGRLVVAQPNGREVTLDEQGGLRVSVALPSSEGHFAALIEEDVAATLTLGLAFADWLLSYVDPTQRLARIAIAAKIDAEGATWLTRAEHNASPNGGTVRMWGNENGGSAVTLRPPDRPRAALRAERDRVAEDFVTLFRRRLRA